MICIDWTAQSVDPVCNVVLILDHSTDVDQLKGALVQKSVSVGCDRAVINSDPTKFKSLSVSEITEKPNLSELLQVPSSHWAPT